MELGDFSLYRESKQIKLSSAFYYFHFEHFENGSLTDSLQTIRFYYNVFLTWLSKNVHNCLL